MGEATSPIARWDGLVPTQPADRSNRLVAVGCALFVITTPELAVDAARTAHGILHCRQHHAYGGQGHRSRDARTAASAAGKMQGQDATANCKERWGYTYDDACALVTLSYITCRNTCVHVQLQGACCSMLRRCVNHGREFTRGFAWARHRSTTDWQVNPY